MVFYLRLLVLTSVFCHCLFSSPCTAASLFPLQTEDARLLPRDAGEFRLGLSYSEGLRQQFQREDTDRRLAELPGIALRVGLGDRVEGQLSYAFLRLQEEGLGTKYGSGDMTFGFKVGLHPGDDSWPALALLAATKLPNADNRKNLGTDQTDVFFDLLATREGAFAVYFLNLGLAILGDPEGLSNRQDDLLRYAAGFMLPLRQGALLLAAEGLDFGNPGSLNRRGAVRGGIQWPAGNLRFDLGGSVGYVRQSEDWSIRAGMTVPFDLRQWRWTRWEPRP